MAGDWIKMENVTPDKPEVFQIAEQLGIDPDAVTGKLIRIWVWADQQTEDGNARGVTRLLLDRLSGVTGFANALISVGWLRETQDGLEFVNFDRHNGKTAKKRALTARRVAKFKQKSNEEGNGLVTQPTLPSALPREEKRREEYKNPPIAPPSGGTRAERGSRLPDDWSLPDEWRQWVLTNTHGVDADREAHKFLDFWRAKVGAGATKKDWFATWRNWCRNVEERHGKKRPELDWMKEAM